MFTFKEYRVIDKKVQKAIEKGDVKELEFFLNFRSKVYAGISAPDELDATDKYIRNQLSRHSQ